ncbi:MAG: hypothetical protein SFV20_11360 [Sphingopyxis sp.]|nr:hypothetical protein [Sphingopyxis sp.]
MIIENNALSYIAPLCFHRGMFELAANPLSEHVRYRVKLRSFLGLSANHPGLPFAPNLAACGR